MRIILAMVAIALVPVFLLGLSGKGEASQSVRVAFIGDQGSGEYAVPVLQLIKAEAAEVVLIQGDFDYACGCAGQDGCDGGGPVAWDAQLTEILGDSFPVFASLGNHEICELEGYQQVNGARLAAVDKANCKGELLVKATCKYKNLRMVFVAPNLVGDGDTEYAPYIREQFAKTKNLWRICSWHENQAEMQVAYQQSDTGWGVYEACREAGAIIVTAHDHVYARTHLLSSIQNQTIASTSNLLAIERGKTFVVVSGLGGHPYRLDQTRSDDYWASIYTEDQEARLGALFCDFGVKEADCYFKNVDGGLVDQFQIARGK